MFSNPYIFHFTKQSEYQGQIFSAREHLIQIVNQGILNGHTVPFTVNHDRVVCFLDYPLVDCALWYKYARDNFLKGKYSPFGIALSKKRLFGLGARHAIYAPEDVKHLIPRDLAFLYTKFELRDGAEPLDFSWEKEWRYKGDLALTGLVEFLIVPSKGEAEAVRSKLNAPDIEIVVLATLV